MKTQQEISEIAEREAAELNLLEEQEFKEGYIKGYQAAQEEMKWISVEDKPLVRKIGEHGWESVHENFDMEFLAAVPYNDSREKDKHQWWIKHCIIVDDIGLCVILDDDYEPAVWDITDVTHYQFIPKPPKPLIP